MSVRPEVEVLLQTVNEILPRFGSKVTCTQTADEDHRYVLLEFIARTPSKILEVQLEMFVPPEGPVLFHMTFPDSRRVEDNISIGMAGAMFSTAFAYHGLLLKKVAELGLV